MWPRFGASKLITRWIAITLVASIVAAVDGGGLAFWTALSPDRVWRGEVWRLITWIFVEPAPMSLVLTCVTIYKFGGELAPRWGDRRLRRFMLQLVLAGGVLMCLLAWVSDLVWNVYRVGGWVVSDALVIAWARQYPTAVLQLYGFLSLSGRQLVGFTVGVTVLIAIFFHPLVFTPELVACFGAAYYPFAWLRR